MKYYTSTIPATLAEKLKAAGMPILIEQEWYINGMPKAEKDCHKPMTKYCEVFDWLMDLGYQILLFVNNDGRNFGVDAEVWSMKIGFTKLERKDTWHEAANAAIEKALELIK